MRLEKCNTLDCFGNRDGRCEILSDTNFDGKLCPFYKHETEVDKREIEEAIREYKGAYKPRSKEAAKKTRDWTE